MHSQTPRLQGLPQFPESLWLGSTELPSFPKLAEDHVTDVAIVGAGITGITTAYLLSSAGYKVTLLEAGTVLGGTTGFTSAKISAQHGMIYHDLLKHFGEEQARAYYHSNSEALEWMVATAGELGLSCDMKREDAYLYADMGDEKTLKQLAAEYEAYVKLGLPGEWQDRVSLPLRAGGAIRLPGQARFHPLHYLKGLLQAVLDKGGTVYEHTMIGEKVDTDGRLTLYTEGSSCKITCRHAVSASHFPFYDGGSLYFSRLHAERSYCLAVEPETDYEGGMYLSAGEPTRSLRAVEWGDQKLVIVGGENHKTGQGICTFGHYEKLERFAGELLGIRSVPYRWSTQDLITLDRVPYIGKRAEDEEIYIATGFGKWGMTSGTLAARLITDGILGSSNPYAGLYDPSRFKAIPGIKNFIVQNFSVTKELVAGKVEIIHKKTQDLAPDEGAVVLHDGKRVGGYRDSGGTLHLVDRTCTHLGCECEWNEAERTWDCPCHGSRFSYNGDVIEGPATVPLKQLTAEN
ncbi:FAD-dependent oxidoreductase [Paenibacillus sp. MMS20-IR301]|uniref:FAD-dependent oxidoreductase n=1 Tax=Paenibacillus sp. MMS20-IR301 TaxID=2895946 RepID=UPI0028F11913|nr:FAD-dependent oxidoreductase [Paenibacillus sp. MMS20-IR301]WNS42564.1 FAD-dependent oxidoreductase [Paenibacillus sp. MMS20-IR301]